MSSYPRISIITPNLNQREYLEETILSVINQKYPELEYIIIDGGSTDGSIEIIKKYAHHINYWISEEDVSQSDAINKGFIVATGDIINWLNSDDLLTPGALFKIAENFKNDIKVVTTTVQNFDENGLRWNELTPVFNSPVQYLCKTFNNQPGTYFKKRVLDNYFPLPKQLHYVMDQYLWFCFWLSNTIKDFTIDEYISVYFRRHNKSKTFHSLKEEVIKGLGKSFFNEYNLLFWSYFIKHDHNKAAIIENYFSDGYDYVSNKITFPLMLSSYTNNNDEIFTTYLFELLKEDYKLGHFKRFLKTYHYIEKKFLDKEAQSELKKIYFKAKNSMFHKFYRKTYWFIRGKISRLK